MDEALKLNVSRRLLELYCEFKQMYVRFDDPGHDSEKDKVAYRVPKYYDITNIISHLEGEYAIAVFAGDKATRFISIDIDDGGAVVAKRVMDVMVEIGIPRERIYVSFSGKKGYHVEVFFKDYISNDDAGKLYEMIVYWGEFNRNKVEFRPTAKQSIKLPLGIHQTTKNRCWFVDPETFDLIENFEYIMGIERIDAKEIRKIISKSWSRYVSEIYAARKKWRKERNEQKQSITRPGSYDDLVVRSFGTRHNLQAKVAARARMDGCDYDEIVERQMKWYRNQDRSLIRSTEGEVQVEAEELAAWAMAHVQVKQFEAMEYSEQSVATITKQMIPYILHAPTPAMRRVLFLLLVYCSKYGEVKISHDKIASQLGMPYNTVKNAAGRLGKIGYLKVTSNYVKNNPRTYVRGANKYSFPGIAYLRSPNSEYLMAEAYDVKEWITPENGEDIYIDMLTSMCTMEYLERFLKKPELKKCKERVMQLAGQGAGDDAGGSA